MSETTRSNTDLVLQEQLLPGVSRTFALTIPQLPGELRTAVTNAYLLCRIADTIEDDARMTIEHKVQFHERFLAALGGKDDPGALGRDLSDGLAPETIPAERELTRQIPLVVRVTSKLPDTCRRAIERCVNIMCLGMPRFQRQTSASGLPALRDVERYCYYVAGVVGEMLTDLFCEHNQHIATHRERLQRLAIGFGQGLQLTNILKDFWDDRQRGACWLSNDVFAAAGIDPADIDSPALKGRVSEVFNRYVGIAHACLRDALTYVSYIPPEEAGIRRFCLWAIGLAIMTLRKIHRNPGFRSSEQVKVSRRTLRLVVGACNTFSRSNRALGTIFSMAARGVPLARGYGAKDSRDLLDEDFRLLLEGHLAAKVSA